MGLNRSCAESERLEIEGEVALPESARWVDMLVPFGPDPSDAWGPLRPDLTNRNVFLEVYSRSVPAKDLTTCVLESVWAKE